MTTTPDPTETRWTHIAYGHWQRLTSGDVLTVEPIAAGLYEAYRRPANGAGYGVRDSTVYGSEAAAMAAADKLHMPQCTGTGGPNHVCSR